MAIHQLPNNLALPGKSMRSTLSKPMTEHEKDELLDILSELPYENAMNLEEVDGFFAALHACPDMISFNNYCVFSVS